MSWVTETLTEEIPFELWVGATCETSDLATSWFYNCIDLTDDAQYCEMLTEYMDIEGPDSNGMWFLSGACRCYDPTGGAGRCGNMSTNECGVHTSSISPTCYGP
ncbi:MAG TPA: hypothetical protein PKY77_05875 [Phycisphaerae bacterium]|nr:hypothetical protein [Phycisphaerae bacterium]HRY69027.1 hypothetical protein [Phycisphaerae bacterium]HSA25998.1 hypothetical protein [Phycisphaerae bacterium]